MTPVLLLALLLTGTPDGGISPADPAGSVGSVGSTDVVALLKADPAPFDGLLVTEKRFTEYLHQTVDLEVATASLKACEGLTCDTPLVSSKTAFWIGAAVGVVVAGVVVFGAVELGKAASK
jgi:hypothetical protein